MVAFISIEDEKKIFSFADISLLEDISELPENISERYKDLPYRVQVMQSDEENAFASLWGNIYLTSGFLENVESYEALDFIVGHEAGHIHHRDVLRGIVAELPITVILSLAGAWWSEKVLQSVIGNSFSKYQESRADRYGIEYSYTKNGHIWCALDFFHAHNNIGWNITEMFSTHPMTEFRIERLKKYADSKGYTEGECTKFTYKN